MRPWRRGSGEKKGKRKRVQLGTGGKGKKGESSEVSLTMEGGKRKTETSPEGKRRGNVFRLSCTKGPEGEMKGKTNDS